MKAKLINVKFRLADGTFVEASQTASDGWPDRFEICGAVGPLKDQGRVDAALTMVTAMSRTLRTTPETGHEKKVKKKQVKKRKGTRTTPKRP